MVKTAAYGIHLILNQSVILGVYDQINMICQGF